MHSVDDGHDTPSNLMALVPVGAGGSWTVQDVPFHFSAKGCCFSVLFPKYPTATHSVDDGHDTPNNPVNVAPVGAGGSWTVQDVPFHFSANGTYFPELFSKYPTAM